MTDYTASQQFQIMAKRWSIFTVGGYEQNYKDAVTFHAINIQKAHFHL